MSGRLLRSYKLIRENRFKLVHGDGVRLGTYLNKKILQILGEN